MDIQLSNSRISVHFLNARGNLDVLVPPVSEAIALVAEKIGTIVKLGAIDIVVRAGHGVIQSIGHVGAAYIPAEISLTFDPDNPVVFDNLGDTLHRTLAHEFHHALRWGSVGYGNSLGEALVSEGLAEQFVTEIFGPKPNPFITAIEPKALREYTHMVRANWDATDYDHPKWFFGQGDLPNWLGYMFGFELVDAYLAEHPQAPPSKLADEPAESFLTSLDLMAHR